jgi:formylglycine-generating enzyme required for sulfatase activity
MVGNVWEWTRSRVFGRIVSSAQADDRFGPTAWDDSDKEAEQTPVHPLRDVVDAHDDLSYRATRGGSFFSIDEQAAWHPAYRLCDPPFSSYFDLGFRFAVYPQEIQ